jgi:4-amino-4-deoxy-L-arabinose transferase-like glycosyltransferase
LAAEARYDTVDAMTDGPDTPDPRRDEPLAPDTRAVRDEPLAPATIAAPRPRPLGLELALVVVVSLAVFVPGIHRYSLVDPWETHYGEVARVMLQNHDWVHTDWPGGMDPKDHEGFRSKPVLSFWLMAASMSAFGVADDGGYSGEMVDSVMTMVAIRIPFILMAVMGLTLMWWMLARLVSRRMAWLGLLVVGTTPMFAMVARNAIPDMPHLACLIGALSMFTMSLEHGDRPIDVAFSVRLGRRQLHVTHLHVFLALVGGFVLIQCVYYVLYFLSSPRLAVRQFPNPVLFFPLLMGLLFGGLSRLGWMIVRFPFVIIGSAIAFFASPKKHTLESFDDWEHYAPDRAIVRGLAFPVVWANGRDWAATARVADHILGMAPLSTMRQIYMLWAYAFLGVGILAKGPPGLAVFGLVAALYVVLLNKWRDLYNGHFEIKRGLLLMIVVFLPWHIGMYLKSGVQFINEYVFTHVLNRAAAGVDNSPGTLANIAGAQGGYAGIIGHGMWLWAALLPAALAAALLRARTDTREGRVRFLMTLWAIGATTLFLVIQTKFHHYILPALPALGLLVAFFLDDILGDRDRLHPIYAALGIGIVLLMTRDLMWEPDRWIEMFVFRYDRPWPWTEPYVVDPSDGFFGLGVFAAIAIAATALPWRRVGVALLGFAGLAICIWALQVYMPDAGKHWGMREAVRDYYRLRTIYGEKIVYFSPRQVYDDWHDVKDSWTFETMIPDTLHIGQPMMIRVQLNKMDKQDAVLEEMGMVGTVKRIGDHEVEVAIAPGERAKIDALVARGKADKQRRLRPPIRVVDADRLLAWQLYWRGENFWSADEIFGPVPEMRTGFNKPDNVDFLKYLGDRTKAPLGRRYFIITESGRATSVRGVLPTQRAKETFETVNTESNKFTLVSFSL